MTTVMARDLMTQNPRCCTPQESIGDVARMMVDGDCGAIPVVDAPQTRHLIGMITDRDIVCRVVAKDLNPVECPVSMAMTLNVASLRQDATLHDCVRAMERWQVRRIPMVDDRGKLIGIVAQADLARASERQPELEHELAEMVEQVSEPPDFVAVEPV
jgi:CBS domain-containing protein